MHAVVRDRLDVRKRLTELKEKSRNNRPLSVFMFGIDSISRLNFIRSMPLTYQYVHDNQWFELHGYNKVKSTNMNKLLVKKLRALIHKLFKNDLKFILKFNRFFFIIQFSDR